MIFKSKYKTIIFTAVLSIFANINGTCFADQINDVDRARKGKISIKSLRNTQNHNVQRPMLSAPLLTRNEHVELIYNKGGIFITVPGKTLEPGDLGDEIRALNIRSKAIMTGVITGPNHVAIY